MPGTLEVLGAGLLALGLYAMAEPFRLRVQRWQVALPGWSVPPLRIAVLADVHIGPPWMTLARLRRIVARVNALAPDLVLLAGDFAPGHMFRMGEVPLARVAGVLAGLRAPLGPFAVLGNHDWTRDRAAQALGRGPTEAHAALAGAGIPLLENEAIRLQHPGGAMSGAPRPGSRATGNGTHFWLAGLGDQRAFGRSWWVPPRGVDDLPATLRQIKDDAPAILLAHEPDIFPQVPEQVVLTVSGHTHGGQIRLGGWAPVVPSRFGNRYAWGHVRERGRDLVVSGGLGCSGLPLRFGVPPEITLIELAQAAPREG